jgi:hypothetical protein
MENGEVDSYNNVLFYTLSRWIKRDIECIVLSIKVMIMVQVYNKMSDYNDKVMVCLISEIEIQYIKHLRRVYQYAYNRSAGGVSRKIRKDGWASRLNHLF